MKKMKNIASTNPLVFMVIVAAITAAISFGIAFAVSSNKIFKANCEGTCVALHENKANPDTIAVKAGSFVQFNSADGKTHSLSIGKGGEAHSHSGSFSSGDFKADEAWKVQFKKDGTYSFHDHYNPKINVLVVVYTPGKDNKIE